MITCTSVVIFESRPHEPHIEKLKNLPNSQQHRAIRYVLIPDTRAGTLQFHPLQSLISQFAAPSHRILTNRKYG